MDKNDEQILVVKSDIIFKDGKWQGLKTDNLDYYVDLIKKNCEFKRRGDMENDSSYQQIIPYMIFSFENKFFAYKYIKNAGETRLINNDYQLGVGGHINKEDIQNGGDILEQGAMREWEEEVGFKGNFLQKKLIGIVNDESREVEQVHLGLVYHFIGDSPEIQVKETDKMEGKLFDLNEISGSMSHSPWMQIVYNEYLSKVNQEKRIIKNVIFDWSGVIKDAVQDHVWVVNRMFKNLGDKEINLEEIRQNWEQPYMKFWNKYYPEMTLEEEQKIYYEAILSKDCPPAKIYPGIIELIKKLKTRGVAMAVLSSDPPETLLEEVKKFGLENIFCEVINKIHDKADGINGLMERNNFKKEETVFIGDTNHEIEVGKRADIKTIAVTWGLYPEDRLKALNPDFLVHNIKELEEILLPPNTVKDKQGKFFVFEGIDGCGKATQTKLLAEYYRQKGFEVERIDFPQHGERSSAMVDDYLTGKYGGSEEVGPYIASIFYAQDRYDASFKIRKWLDEGKIVISDRYLVSNVGHQGGKLVKDKEAWKKYVNWLYNLEYGIFGIPKPDYTFILKTSAEFSMRLANNITDAEKKQTRINYLGDDKKQDIHEKDENHLENALSSYIMAAEEFPDDFRVIECLETRLLPPNDISQKVIEEIQKI
jgi:dTMP kinase